MSENKHPIYIDKSQGKNGRNVWILLVAWFLMIYFEINAGRNLVRSIGEEIDTALAILFVVFFVLILFYVFYFYEALYSAYKIEIKEDGNYLAHLYFNRKVEFSNEDLLKVTTFKVKGLRNIATLFTAKNDNYKLWLENGSRLYVGGKMENASDLIRNIG